MTRYRTVSRHLFRRTARTREQVLTVFLDRSDWDALEGLGVREPEGVSEFRVSPGRSGGFWRVQVRR